MNINYVVSSMIFWWRENHLSLEHECQYLKSQGMGVEFWPNINGLDKCRYDRKNWSRLADATEGMLVSIRSRTDKPNTERWREQIELAKLLNANIVATLQSLGLSDGTQPNGCGFASEVIEMAKLANINICLETGPLHIVKQVGEKFPCLTYCLDAGFANLDPNFSFGQYVDELSPRIAHLHLTDNYGVIDDHLPPGREGGISAEDWDYLLAELNKSDRDIIAALEMSPSMPAVMLKQAREFLFNKMNWPNKPEPQLDHEQVVYNPH